MPRNRGDSRAPWGNCGRLSLSDSEKLELRFFPYFAMEARGGGFGTLKSSGEKTWGSFSGGEVGG